jgi:nicotinamide mononucleotide transporter
VFSLDGLIAALPGGLFAAAFTLFGSPFTWLELAAFALSIAMVVANMRVWHGAWPLAIAASALYAVFFAQGKLYGEAALQLFFIAVSVWGWWCWWTARHAQQPSLGVAHTPRKEAIIYIALSLTCVPTFWLFLSKFTDSTVPLADSIPTVLSVIGQIMLARKRIENWLVWVVVNVLSVALFAYKGWWLTTLLYALFAVLSVQGWLSWRRLLVGKV